jgi:hypothetical protein
MTFPKGVDTFFFVDRGANSMYQFIETAYEFEIKNFHVGPAFEFAYDPEDFHISLGLHCGFGF